MRLYEDVNERYEREYTAREIRMIEERQREMRWDWYRQRVDAHLPIIAIVAIAVAGVALAIILGVN